NWLESGLKQELHATRQNHRRNTRGIDGNRCARKRLRKRVAIGKSIESETKTVGNQPLDRAASGHVVECLRCEHKDCVNRCEARESAVANETRCYRNMYRPTARKPGQRQRAE